MEVVAYLEWRVPYRVVNCIVILMLNHYKRLSPLGCSRLTNTKGMNQGPIHYLRLPISLWVLGNRILEFSSQKSPQHSPKMAEKT